jgi:predicted RNA-binding Zn-ribbon protein involved in translation (DUF1610 family)
MNCAIEKEKKLWTVTTIGDMLKSEVYLGKTIYRRQRVATVGGSKKINNDREDWIVIEGMHEPIVSEELFAKANEKAFTHKKLPFKPKKKNSPILMCPACGRRLALNGSNKVYRCPHAHLSGIPECSNSRMEKNELEETVLNCARNMVNFISENLQIKKKEWANSSMMEEKIATLEGERKRLSARKMKLYSDYRAGAVSLEKYISERKTLLESLNEIDRRIPEIENEMEEFKKQIEEAGEKQADLNDVAALQTFDKAVLHKIIDRVFIYGGGRIEIVWKMDDFFLDGEKREVIEVHKQTEE